MSIKMKRSLVFCLSFLCLSCVPIGLTPTAPNQQGAQITGGIPIETTETTPVSKIATHQLGATPIINPLKETAVPRRLLLFRQQYQMFSGEKLDLEGGITDEAREILEAGNTGTFLLAFLYAPDKTVKHDLQEAGITLYDIGWLFADVPPAALDYLETLANEGSLVYAGVLPPAVKIDKRSSEAIQGSPDGSSQISVSLIHPPDEVMKKIIESYFDELIWPENMNYPMPFIDGIIQNKNIWELAKLPIILWISIPGDVSSN